MQYRVAIETCLILIMMCSPCRLKGPSPYSAFDEPLDLIGLAEVGKLRVSPINSNDPPSLLPLRLPPAKNLLLLQQFSTGKETVYFSNGSRTAFIRSSRRAFHSLIQASIG